METRNYIDGVRQDGPIYMLDTLPESILIELYNSSKSYIESYEGGDTWYSQPAVARNYGYLEQLKIELEKRLL